MKATVKITDLTAALARAKTLVSRKTTLPILGGVLIEALVDGETLKLTVTDLDNYLVLTVPAKVNVEGSVVIPCVRLQAALAKIDGEEIALSANTKNVLTGKSNGMRFELLGLDAAEMPKLPAIEDPVEQSFAEGVLSAALDRELGAVSDDETRFVLCGVYFTQTDGSVRMVATDGRRLAVTALASYKSDGKGLDVIVPTDACKQMACLDGGGATRLRVTASQIEASGHGWTLISKRIDGNYPNWRQVMPPAGGAHRFLVDRTQFAEAVTFAATMCSANNMAVKLQLDGKTLKVLATTPDIGNAEADLSAEVTGGVLLAGFNPEFLLNAIKALEGPNITGEIQDEISPLRLQDEKTVHVLMPMRVS